MDIKYINEEDRGMTLHRKDDLLWLSFPKFDSYKWLKNGFSTRFGGVSKGHLASLNLDFRRGDDENAVRTNYERIAAAIGFQTEDLVFAHQTHKANVLKVGRKDRGAGFLREVPWRDIDGLITDEPGVVLTVLAADCLSVYLVDPDHQAIGLVHSGWRGTEAGIAANAVRAMQEAYGSEPSSMYAAIGPSICQDCYEVGEEVAIHFPNCYVIGKGGGKYLLDLQGTNRGILAEAGIPVDHISLPNLCTCCNPDLFYSHRAAGPKRGELAAFLGILGPS